MTQPAPAKCVTCGCPESDLLHEQDCGSLEDCEREHPGEEHGYHPFKAQPEPTPRCGVEFALTTIGEKVFRWHCKLPAGHEGEHRGAEIHAAEPTPSTQGSTARPSVEEALAAVELDHSWRCHYPFKNSGYVVAVTREACECGAFDALDAFAATIKAESDAQVRSLREALRQVEQVMTFMPSTFGPGNLLERVREALKAVDESPHDEAPVSN